MRKKNKANEPTYKPDSVPLFKQRGGDHPSGRTIAGRLKQLPTDSGEQPSNIRADIPEGTP
ncbi:hypothetical protein CULC22_01589 [Corynebacterium ulcerans BR-AD22]|uniref:Transposase n=1 Tax=Corynebacterium ulcerans FRC58 TaxID=1408268 RepID=A0ABM5U1X6_CORUL|nr:hypothetical protein CULC22_01589 [Corynebacterium ulcerans BR-AD22]AIU92193.1 Hypothetical protein Cul05146_1631 [Corynebacterium ulcerans]AKN77487.1 Hypothetical protein CulFRC58_1633 [Corynebacterium ulcerans FRC58]ALD95384.1 Hypothetical protein Cul131001_1688 [Corynebacterium ulcerans]GJJ33939.1 hypothetical protein CULCOIPH001_11470 [Corynebacterium ulcerans]